MKATIHNPILSGFCPDPSICRVGEDFWLVTSTFSYFPGLPVFHSRDLAHWTQVGNVLDRPEQLELAGQGISRGLFAPTIRYHNGLYYVVCTNVDGKGNFVVTAENPAGPWSNPSWLKAPGIDPSLFFDTDGSAWYIGTRPAPEGPKYNGNWEVWAQPFDMEKRCLTGESMGLWRGALRDCIWPEGPHVYRIGDWYYLTIAEGGTGPDHAVSVARSKSMSGPWVGKPSNPILTHRHLGSQASIVNVGHADLVDDTDGNWWMVCLASRPRSGLDSPASGDLAGRRVSNMGRETYIVPVRWEDEWPLAAADTGRIEATYEGPCLDLAAAQASRGDTVIEFFDGDALPPNFLFLRTPVEGSWALDPAQGALKLSCQAADLSSKDPVSFVGVRQRHFDWRLSARVRLEGAASSSSAGLALLQSETHQYRFELVAGSSAGDGVERLRVVRVAGGAPQAILDIPFESRWGNAPTLAVTQVAQSLSFFIGPHPGALVRLPVEADARILSTEVAGGFVGTVIGMYASGNGKNDAARAAFSLFSYQSLEK